MLVAHVLTLLHPVEVLSSNDSCNTLPATIAAGSNRLSIMTAPSLSLPLEKLEIIRMSSGHSALVLSEKVSWERFPEYARHLADALDATITDRADVPDGRVWQLTIDGESFYLSFDDYQVALSLEARSDGASQIIGEIQKRLVRLRDGRLDVDAELEHVGDTFRWLKIVGVVLAFPAAYAIAVLSLDFLRVDTCLDLGGSWDREAEACIHEGISIRAAYPTWVYGAFGAMSIIVFLTACASLVAVCMRRWETARRLGGRSFATGLGIVVASLVLATMPAVTSGVSGPESKASRLGKTIAEFMNSTVGVYPGVLIGGATWAAATAAKWRRRRRAA